MRSPSSLPSSVLFLSSSSKAQGLPEALGEEELQGGDRSVTVPAGLGQGCCWGSPCSWPGSGGKRSSRAVLSECVQLQVSWVHVQRLFHGSLLLQVQQQLMMPRKAFLSQKEKQARARERDMLKKRRRRQDYLKRSVEPQKNTETIKWHRDDEKRRENEQVKDKDIKRRWRQDERERRKSVDTMNWHREEEKRENERGKDQEGQEPAKKGGEGERAWMDLGKQQRMVRGEGRTEEELLCFISMHRNISK